MKGTSVMLAAGKESVFGTREEVTFSREGLRIAGRLYTPHGFDTAQTYPGLVLHAAVTMVKEQASENYAWLLAQQGFVVLTFDYTSYGESDGQPRQNENVANKLADLKQAVTYLRDVPYVGSIGAVGLCTSGANVAYLAAQDDRISAAAAIIPWMYEPALAEAFWGTAELARRRARAERAWAAFNADSSGTYDSTQIFTNSDEIEGFNRDNAEYFFDKWRAGAEKNWRNEVFWGAWPEWAYTLDPISQAPNITMPFFVFSSDDALLPAQARNSSMR
jgi:dienelactone hydrolase